MPVRVRKSGRRYLIQHKVGGKWRTAGKSSSKRNAMISASIRRRAKKK